MATPTVVPKPTLVIVGYGKKPKKFNGSDFKRWQQKIFYLTTLNLTAYLHEDISSLKEGETNCLTVAMMEALIKKFVHEIRAFNLSCMKFVLKGWL